MAADLFDLRDVLPDSSSATALRTPERAVASYAEVHAAVAAIVDQGQTLRLQPGHRLATLLPNRPATGLATLVLTHRCSVLPLNPGLTFAELRRQLDEAEVDGLVARPDDALAIRLAEALSLPFLSFVDHGDTGIALGGASGLPAPRLPDRPCGLVLLTSGSTGSPKRVPLRPEQLHVSARSIARHLELTAQDRAVHALPMFHIGAMVDLLLAPWIAGGCAVIADGPHPAALADAVLQGQATWVQLVPTMLSRCLSEYDPALAAEIGARLRFIRSVSSDLAPAQQAEAERFFGGTPLVQMYGLTETAGQVASNPMPPAHRRAGSVGWPTGPQVALLDGTGARVGAGREGEVCVRGPSVTAGYEGGATRDAFFGDWLRTGDLGRFDDDGALWLTGRLKEMINRGGEKISPVEVERAALALPGVAEAVAFALPHATLGEQVGLAIVASPASGLGEAEVLDRLSRHLAAFKLPRRVLVMTAFPRLGSGKVDRRALAAIASDAPDVAGQSVLDSAEARAAAEVWAEILQGPLPRPSDDFFDAGGDSLAATEFLALLEKRLTRPVPASLLYETPRFADMVSVLEAGTVQTDAPVQEDLFDGIRQTTAGWPGQRRAPESLITGVGTVLPGVPLFYCGQAETEALPFREGLGDRHPFYLMRTALGVVEDTGPHNDRLAQRYAAEIRHIQPDGALHLIGNCEGAKLLDLVARRLIDEGREIAVLVSYDHWFACPTPYPVLHLMTDSRRRSARRRWKRPEAAFPVLHPAGGDWVALAGGHVQAIHKAGAKAAVDRLRAYLEGRKSFVPCGEASKVPWDARRALYKARVTGAVPRLFRAGKPADLSLAIRNDSSATWPANDPGFGVMAHFDSLDGVRVTREAAFASFDHPVPPGEAARPVLKVSYPDTRLPLMLQVGLADIGIAEPSDRSCRPLRRLVWVRRG